MTQEDKGREGYPDGVAARMEALVRRLAKHGQERKPPETLVDATDFYDVGTEARAIVALLPAEVDGDLAQMRQDAEAAGWHGSRLEQFEAGLLDLWKRARGRANGPQASQVSWEQRVRRRVDVTGENSRSLASGEG